MTLRIVQFLAVVLTALALVPAGAHLFEMPAKLALTQDDYFVVQTIYRGWALFGTVLIGALIANLALTVLLRGTGLHCALAGSAFLLVAATLAIFFTWTYPANRATRNWTVVPENWEALRTQWEYAHAANAVLTFIAVCALVLALVIPRRRA
ncbi:DUF1772 domain-containing protein [Kaustia mangrovi]|uniref:DUF1772 domain-containing protein n=1 Tax=Kaustia mangrovi TaxID=2593653 RepID=A0A7S8C4L1_9HYPH|nr:DUF1772 domain-containing protein [Kaustia mangrovi]QPC43277.1 DUF1772 domain-containing protein [Kaustia mangrovi]